MNRETFVTLNRTRLFTADQVVDIAQAERDSWTTDELIEHEKLAADAEREKVLDEIEKWCDDNWFSTDQDNPDGGTPCVDVCKLEKILKELREGKDGEWRMFCNTCKRGKKMREFQYLCSHPSFRKSGKLIYEDTVKILAKVGCMGYINNVV